MLNTRRSCSDSNGRPCLYDVRMTSPTSKLSWLRTEFDTEYLYLQHIRISFHYPESAVSRPYFKLIDSTNSSVFFVWFYTLKRGSIGLIEVNENVRFSHLVQTYTHFRWNKLKRESISFFYETKSSAIMCVLKSAITWSHVTLDIHDMLWLTESLYLGQLYALFWRSKNKIE